MCFHTSISHPTRKIEQQLKVKLSDERFRELFDKPNYHHNGFSHPNMLIIPQEKAEVLAPGVWGIVPSNKLTEDIKPYYKEAVKYGGGLNARSEKLFDHFIYKNSIEYQRCVIPVSGFFEPHDYQKKKYPFYIKSASNELMSLAGIYTKIDTYITFTIITKSASPLFEKVHNLKKRQPVILNDNLVEKWLSNDFIKPDIQELIQTKYPDELLEVYPVSKDLFSPKIDSNHEDIIKKANYPELEFKL